MFYVIERDSTANLVKAEPLRYEDEVENLAVACGKVGHIWNCHVLNMLLFLSLR